MYPIRNWTVKVGNKYLDLRSPSYVIEYGHGGLTRSLVRVFTELSDMPILYTTVSYYEEEEIERIANKSNGVLVEIK